MYWLLVIVANRRGFVLLAAEFVVRVLDSSQFIAVGRNIAPITRESSKRKDGRATKKDTHEQQKRYARLKKVRLIVKFSCAVC